LNDRIKAEIIAGFLKIFLRVSPAEQKLCSAVVADSNEQSEQMVGHADNELLE
jgi:hypothetical protein